MNLTENAKTVLATRYLTKDDKGQPNESPEHLFRRVASVVAKDNPKDAKEFYRIMAERKFMPNSPTLMNAGRPLGQLSACFVLPVTDCITNGQDGIYDTLRNMAVVHKSGGGTGFDFSHLRSSGSIVRSTTGVASGPVSFMSLFDASTEVVKQGGTRRGANMGILRVDHPDIMDFIRCKRDTTKITNFNISVAVTNGFMEAVLAKCDYTLTNGEEVYAPDVFDALIEQAHATGEPGLFFIDQANRHNPVPKMGKYEATNPCGEQPLLPNDVCNLGSINLGEFVEEGEINWLDLQETIELSVRFLDNVIDVNDYPLPEIKSLSEQIRRIGLGVMGWADMLIQLGIPYGSPESIQLARTVGKFFRRASHKASAELADDRGAFPAWRESIWGPDDFCARDHNADRIAPEQYMRNCNVTTVAPTGTISIFADCSSGIEPIFAVAFMRNQAGHKMPDVNKYFLKIAKEEGWYSEELIERIAEAGHIHFDEVPKRIQNLFVTAHDVSPDRHVRMQGAWQENIDSAISKTINFPFSATPDQVRHAYIDAYEMDCKGITVYRDGSRGSQPLSTGATAPKLYVEVKEELCPDCDGKLVFESGCEKCPNCAYSACKVA